MPANQNTKKKSAVMGVAQAVIAAGIITAAKGDVASGVVVVLVGVLIGYGYQSLEDRDLRDTANAAARDVDASTIIEGTEQLTGDARTWLNDQLEQEQG